MKTAELYSTREATEILVKSINITYANEDLKKVLITQPI